MAKENSDPPKTPTHRAFAVQRREGQEDFWLNIGLAFPHKDGKGFNIMLQALPIDGKIVCREFTDDDDQPTQQPRNQQRQNGNGGGNGNSNNNRNNRR